VTRGLVRALSLFTILPVRTSPDLTSAQARRAVLWLPAVGLLLGALAGLPGAAVRAWAGHAGLLGATLSVTALAVLTRGLHLDGLADTADGLGSRAPGPRALEIMRQSDIGPFGVVTLILVLGCEVGALDGTVGNSWTPVAAIAVAAATGRLSVLHATLPAIPTAHSEGFGALVRGAATARVAVIETALVLSAGAGLAYWVGDDAAWWVGTQAVALIVTMALRRQTTNRFGGTTGDVFGSLVEVGTVITLVGIALI
jgi:adenosylcobinamide-GDP ribazoletransferase